MKKIKIWIDIVTAPDVPFFYSIIKDLNKNITFEVIITGRKFLQVPELAKKYNLNSISYIDCFYGKKIYGKIFSLIIRAFQLIIFAMFKKIDIAFSFASRPQTLAAWILRKKIVNMYDYEGGEIKIINIMSDFIIIPREFKKLNTFTKSSIQKKIIFYPDLKESVYAYDFIPNTDEIKQFIPIDKIIFIFRTNSTFAHYHGNKSDSIDFELIEYLSSKNNVRVVVFPRYEKQKHLIKKLKQNNHRIVVLERPVNGQNLIWNSDGVISGGGSMIREGVCLGVPSYDIFQGQIGAVEKMLIDTKKVTKINSKSDFNKIKIIKVPLSSKKKKESKLLPLIIDTLSNISK